MKIDETVFGDLKDLRRDDHPEGHYDGQIDLKEVGINVGCALYVDDVESPGESGNLYRRGS
jgi:hypothetical protein